jgi:hypothetical protein
MGIVKAAFLVTVYAEDDDYATFASPARTDWSNAEVQSWLSQNYFERIHDALDVGDRPNTLSWTVDTLPDVEAALEFEASQWSLADAVEGHPGFKEFARSLGQNDEDLAHFDNALAALAEAIEESNESGKGYRDFL